ncbi:MAG: DUF4007 family protein [Deltaproteobacteria bacterium]|nr:DUF4007 family protein [Deltaproteobacteria bacterium]
MGLGDLERPSFSGHETFPFRYTWLKKAYDGVGNDPQLFVREDALATLGVGKNMVRSMRHWALAAGVLEEHAEFPKRRAGFVKRARLGDQLFADDGWDPYLEDPATLWLLHWKIASLPDNCSTWWFVFNELGDGRFTRAQIADRLAALAKAKQWAKVSASSLKRDVDTFMRSYVAPTGARTKAVEDFLDCPLVELRLIRDSGEPGSYEFNRGPQPTLPDEIFAFALGEYVSRRRSSAKTLALEEIQYTQGAPGRVFLLDAAGVAGRLERVHALSGGAWSFDDTAGVAQLLVNRDLDPSRFLVRYFRDAA